MEKQIEILQQQLKQQEKLASLGLLSAGIAHEIQNPLNFNEENISADDREEVEDIVADLKENMAKIVEHGERAISIIQGILLVSRGKEGEFIPSDINHIVKEYVWLAYHALRANHKGFNITIHESYQDGLPQMMVIPQDISRAVLNLMNNACYAVWDRSQKEGEEYVPTIDIKTALNAEGLLEIAIQDNGVGISDEVKEHLYENFFTTKPVGQGTGLGMGITRDIVENRHHGKLTFESEIGKGTCFTIIIPVKKP